MNNMAKENKARSAAILVAIGVLLVAVIAFCNHSNLFALQGIDGTKILDPVVSKPVFSSGSGFFEQSFYLELSAPANTKIYYTLDCSDPDLNSIEYKQPILIENISDTENTYSMLTNVSTGFYTDLMKQYETYYGGPGYQAPDFPVKKCMVVRAVAIDEKGNCSEVVTNSYFVEEDLSFFDGCNIISVVTDPDRLFDDGTGIYVTGKIFDDYLYKKLVGQSWELWEANYRQRGQEWERPVTFVCFDSQGKVLLSSNGGIRVQGGVSRALLPRSLNLFVDEQSVEDGSRDDQLFQAGFYPTKLTLCSGGNDRTANIKDYLVVNRVQTLNFAKLDYQPYVLFLDGEYWGFYWLAGAYNERYLSYHYGVEEDDVIMIKAGALELGNDLDLVCYDNMKKFITTNDMSIQQNYDQACQLIDMDSYLDYFATLTYLARSGDWPSSNYALWRTRSVGDGYGDGKWRWMLFDCNSASMTADLVDHNTLEMVKQSDDMFASLWENQDFQHAFRQRIMEIAEECFDPQEISDFVDGYIAKMLPTLEQSWDRFYGSQNRMGDRCERDLTSYKTFFQERKAVVESWFAE